MFSQYHLVYAKPMQSIRLRLSRHYSPNPTVRTSSKYLKISCTNKTENFEEYTIENSLDVCFWSYYSKVSLGEVWIETGKRSARLLVVLDCLTPEKSDILTVINPQHDIRVEPGNIIEVIIFNEKIECEDWSWEWRSVSGLDVEFLGESRLSLNSGRWYGYYQTGYYTQTYAKMPRTYICHNTGSRQYHFWFRFNRDMVDVLNHESGTKYIGDFHFSGSSKHHSDTDTFSFSVYANLIAKYQLQVLNTLRIPKVDDQTCSGISQQVIVVPKKRLRFVHDVDIMLSTSKSMEEGCQTLPAIPAKISTVMQDEEYPLASIDSNFKKGFCSKIDHCM